MAFDHRTDCVQRQSVDPWTGVFGHRTNALRQSVDPLTAASDPWRAVFDPSIEAFATPLEDCKLDMIWYARMVALFVYVSHVQMGHKGRRA